MGQIVLKRLELLRLEALLETDAEWEEPDSAYQELVAETHQLVQQLEMAQALIANVLTPEETNAARVPSLSTRVSEAQLLLQSVQSRMQVMVWLEGLGFDPREVPDLAELRAQPGSDG